jgi:hypothetical protein
MPPSYLGCSPGEEAGRPGNARLAGTVSKGIAPAELKVVVCLAWMSGRPGNARLEE